MMSWSGVLESLHGDPALDESTNSCRGRVPTLLDTREPWEY